MNQNTDTDTELKERARRVRTARLLTCQPRIFFEHKHGIKSSTLKSWEVPNKSKGITLKGAIKLSNSLSLENIHCSVEWLLNGVGPEPKLASKIQRNQEWNEEFSILAEIELFKQNIQDAIVMLVVDDTMLPFYNPGDHVGGIFREGNLIKKYINRQCIVDTVEHGILIRTVCKGKDNFNLTSTNPISSGNNPILFNVKINKVAEIIWHRKRELK